MLGVLGTPPKRSFLDAARRCYKNRLNQSANPSPLIRAREGWPSAKRRRMVSGMGRTALYLKVSFAGLACGPMGFSSRKAASCFSLNVKSTQWTWQRVLKQGNPTICQAAPEKRSSSQQSDCQTGGVRKKPRRTNEPADQRAKARRSSIGALFVLIVLFCVLPHGLRTSSSTNSPVEAPLVRLATDMKGHTRTTATHF